MIISLFLFSLSTQAANFHAGRLTDCENLLLRSGPMKIIGSGRNEELMPQYREAFEEIFGEGGVLNQLGVVVQPMTAEFVQGGEIDYLSGSAIHPARHWHDGAAILRTIQSSGSILEFVTTGRTHSHAYFRDDLPFEEQLLIMLHVAGHFHFAQQSRFKQVRTADAMADSWHFNELMERLLHSESRSEVIEFYHFLKAMEHFQDFSRGNHEPPEDFIPARTTRKTPYDKASEAVHPRRPTPAILQAYVHNLPPGTPEWKVEMLQQFERLRRHYSGAVVTKIQNEGWASIFQELVSEHTSYSDFRTVMMQTHLLPGVFRPSITNPYWLGREAWRNLRRRFNLKPENQGLAPLERDKRFIAWAVENVMAKRRDDFSFLTFALDEYWVRSHQLALTRPATWGEMNPNLPPPPPGLFKQPTQLKVVSKDWKAVVHNIRRSAADMRIRAPRPVLADFNYAGTGRVWIRFDDEIGQVVPLERHSMVRSLYFHARLMERPVMLDTVMPSTWMTPRGKNGLPPVPYPIVLKDPNFPKIYNPWNLELSRIRVVVEPNGKVQASLRSLDGEEVLIPMLSEQFTEEVAAFREDLESTYDEGHQSLLRQKLSRAAMSASQAYVDSLPTSFFSHAPSAAGALHELHIMLSHRMAAAMEKALKDNSRIRRGNGQIQISALPDTPGFHFDTSILMAIIQSKLPRQGPWDYLRSQAQVTLPATQDPGEDIDPFVPEDAYDLGSAPVDEGGVIWGESPGSQGDEGEGDEPGGDKRGDSPSEESFADMSPDDYAAMLGADITLPILRPKDGRSRGTSTEKEGEINMPIGELVEDTMAELAMKKGRAAQKESGEKWSLSKILRQGYRLLTEGDIHVEDEIPVPEPDLSAVVTVVADFSGSVPDWGVTAAKQITFDAKALLTRKYKHIEFRYVAMDSSGHIYEKPEDFYRVQLGGGTSYRAGLESVQKVHLDFPRARYDRYVIGIGDLDDVAEPVIEKLAEVTTESDFMAIVRLGPAGYQGPLAQKVEQLAANDPFFAFVELGKEEGGYAPEVLKKVFKNEE